MLLFLVATTVFIVIRDVVKREADVATYAVASAGLVMLGVYFAL